MSKAPERIFICKHFGEYGPYFPEAVEAEGEYGGEAVEYVRADLLPVVKPLEWGDPDRIGNLYCNVPLGGQFEGYYLIEPNENGLVDVTFGVVCHEFDGDVIWRGPKEDAVDAVNAHNAARIRANLDMIDPAALVAGAYEAAAMEFDGWDNVPVQMTYDESRDRIRALTPVHARAALDAAIAKAVNEKLEEVAKAVAGQAQKADEANTPISAYALRYARDTILEMKEPE